MSRLFGEEIFSNLADFKRIHTAKNMLYNFPLPLRKLVNELAKIPSIGERTAFRLAYHLVCRNQALAKSLSERLIEAVNSIKFCAKCSGLCTSDICEICCDGSRNHTELCIVEKPIDVYSIERVGEYRGLYHVLNQLWSPSKGLTPEDLGVQAIISRIKSDHVKEVIIATGATLEGEATALYLAEELSSIGDLSITMLAQGMPKGGEIEYADEFTLSRAFLGRVSARKEES